MSGAVRLRAAFTAPKGFDPIAHLEMRIGELTQGIDFVAGLPEVPQSVVDRLVQWRSELAHELGQRKKGLRL